MNKTVFVVGGAALDITGAPESVFRLRDSNIGRVRISVGGVGKNIAANLCSYDLHVELITALGTDFRGEMIQRECAAGGVSLTHSLVAPGAAATYLSVLDGEGDMLAGISDMGIIERLTPEFLQTKLNVLNSASLVVLDANLSPESLAFLCQSLTVPIFYEPVSVAKCTRIGSHIGRMYAIKPNRFEAAQLSGRSCDTLRGVFRATDWFLEQGVERVFISLADEGVYWADQKSCGLMEAEQFQLVDVTGAGDAMCAAIIHGCVEGLGTEQCAKAGNHASAVVCSAPRA